MVYIYWFMLIFMAMYVALFGSLWSIFGGQYF